MDVISEATFFDMSLIREKEVIVDLSDVGRDFECKFEIKAFAHPPDTDDLFKNDFFGPILTLSNRFKEPKMFLEKLEGCDWIEQTALIDDTYGEFTTFLSQPNWLGYKLQWHLVQDAFGIGCYRIRKEFKDLFDNVSVSFSFRYNLKLYSEGFADRTVKFTYTQDGGKIGDIFDDERVIDFKDIIWDSEMRLEGFFGFETGENDREFVRYETGAETPSLDKHIEKLICVIRPIPYYMHRILKINILQSWNLAISDYNLINVSKDRIYDHKFIKPLGGYEPVWSRNNSYAPLELEFEPHFQNFERTRC